MLRNSSGDWNAGINAVRLDTESGSVEKKGAGAEQEGEGGEERREWMKGRDRWMQDRRDQTRRVG